jgi:hypothetical protein
MAQLFFALEKAIDVWRFLERIKISRNEDHSRVGDDFSMV